MSAGSRNDDRSGPSNAPGAGLPPAAGARIAFASPHCLADPTSGAAIATTRAMQFLETLGFRCAAFCGPRVDSGEDIETALARHDIPCQARNADIGGYQARILSASWSGALGGWQALPITIFAPVKRGGDELAAFYTAYAGFLDRFRPDVLLTYGGDSASLAMIAPAKARGAVVVFLLGNFAYQKPRTFAAVDYVVVPSEFSREYYRRELGLACHCLPNVLDRQRVCVTDRQPLYVTFVNPQPAKGLFVFARIAQVLAARRPDILFQVVEGRSRTGWRQETGIALDRLPNTKIMPSTADPRTFYATTRLMLMPSLGNESFGLVAAEAMINAIPVLAGNRGALPETIGEAGFLFDIPGCYTAQTQMLPTTQEVEPWVATIIQLWDDAELCQRVGRAARERAERWQPARLAPIYRDFFRSILPRQAVEKTEPQR